MSSDSLLGEVPLILQCYLFKDSFLRSFFSLSCQLFCFGTYHYGGTCHIALWFCICSKISVSFRGASFNFSETLTRIWFLSHRMLRELNELMHEKHLAWHLVYSESSVNISSYILVFILIKIIVIVTDMSFTRWWTPQGLGLFWGHNRYSIYVKRNTDKEDRGRGRGGGKRREGGSVQQRRRWHFQVGPEVTASVARTSLSSWGGS